MSSVKILYRQLLRTAKLLPERQVEPAITQIKETFRKNRTLSDPKQIQKCIEEGEGRLKFMKMVTPRLPSSKAENTVYRVNEKGELVEGHGDLRNSARLSHFGMTTSEMRYINEQQMRRMSFMPYKKRS